jgi:hypothetical protein
MGGKIFDDPVLRGLQFEQTMLVLLFGKFLSYLFKLSRRIDTLCMQLSFIIGGYLADFFAGLGNNRQTAFDHIFLGFQVMLFLDTFPPFVRGI